MNANGEGTELIWGLGSTEKVMSQRGRKDRLRRKWRGEVTEAVKAQGRWPKERNSAGGRRRT